MSTEKTLAMPLGSLKSHFSTRSAAALTSSLGLRDTAQVLKPLDEKCLMVWMPTLGPAPRTKRVFEKAIYNGMN